MVNKTYVTGSEFGNKNRFAKNSELSKENSLPRTKFFFGFVGHFSEFVKEIYETCESFFIASWDIQF